MLTIDDWASLTQIQKKQDEQYLKENRMKSLVGNLVCVAIILFSIHQELFSHVYLWISLLISNLTLTILCFRLKSPRNVRLWVYVFFFVFITHLFIYGYFLMPGTAASAIIYCGLMSIYLRELEGGKKIHFFVFAIYAISLLILLPLGGDLRFYTITFMLFITAASFRNINLNRDIVIMKQRQASFDLFQRHRTYIEHHTINSLTRMKYYLESLKSNGSDGTELIAKMEEEVNQIKDKIQNTDPEQLESFEV